MNTCQAPYQDLHIYYLQGLPSRDSLRDEPFFLGCWEEGDTAFLFFSKPSDDRVEGLLARQPRLALLDRYHMSYEDWQGQVALSPVRAGPFVVHPYWAPVEVSKGDIPVPLDPGLVFGTGFHPTTRDCLEAVSLLWERTQPDHVLDLGCGTGVLSLAWAALDPLRPRSIIAVDKNPLCVETAGRNAKRNGWEKRIRVVEGSAEAFISVPAEVILANIHFEVLRALVSHPAFRLKKWAVLSGLLRSQCQTILEVLAEMPVEVIGLWNEDPVWRTVLVRIHGVE